MRVTVRHLWACEPELDRWVESLPGSEPDRRDLARTHLEQVHQWMRDNNGVPPGAIRVPGISPMSYWWEFFPGWWMRFVVRDRRRLWWTVAREVVVLAIQDDPPSPVNFAR